MPEPLRIVVFGTECTGKSTLAERLAAHFGEPWAPEYVRRFWDEHGGVITADDLDVIARGQAAAEDAAAAGARRAYFCDTDLLTHTLWDDILFPGACPVWARAEAARRARATALFLFCEADIDWKPDPQRCFPDAGTRARYNLHWRDALVSRGLPHAVIAGDRARRELDARRAVEKLLDA